jgi:hypothetical protein
MPAGRRAFGPPGCHPSLPTRARGTPRHACPAAAAIATPPGRPRPCRCARRAPQRAWPQSPRLLQHRGPARTLLHSEARRAARPPNGPTLCCCRQPGTPRVRAGIPHPPAFSPARRLTQAAQRRRRRRRPCPRRRGTAPPDPCSCAAAPRASLAPARPSRGHAPPPAPQGAQAIAPRAPPPPAARLPPRHPSLLPGAAADRLGASERRARPLCVIPSGKGNLSLGVTGVTGPAY